MYETRRPVTTPELVEELAKLRNLITEAREKRHDGNGALNEVLLAVQNTSETHHERLEVVEKVMLHDFPMLVRDIQIIKTRIVGDDAMKIPGLVQQMNSLDRDVQALTPRLEAVESAAEKVKLMEVKLETVNVLATSTSWDLKVMKIVGSAVTAAVLAIGGIVTWAKATEVVKFLSTKGQ